MVTRENTSPLISNITIHPGLPDHYAIITDMNLKKPPMPTISVTTRHWKNVNIQDLCYDIESQLENVNLEYGELDSCVNLFESTVRNILDDHAPLKPELLNYNLNPPGSMTTFVLQGKPAVNLSENGMTMGNLKYIGKNIVTNVIL